MKTEIELFVNQKGFKEYAVRYRKHRWNRWKYATDFAGRRALFRLQDAVTKQEELISNK